MAAKKADCRAKNGTFSENLVIKGLIQCFGIGKAWLTIWRLSRPQTRDVSVCVAAWLSWWVLLAKIHASFF